MFKSLDYIGLEGRPELRAAAERLTPLLVGEINTWRDQVAVTWSPTGCGELVLSLSLTLSGDVSESASGVFTTKELAGGDRAANRCAMVWIELLGTIAWRIHARVEESLLEPTGV